MSKYFYLIAIFFILPLTTNAAVTWSRTPSGTEITSPVTVDVNFLMEDFTQDVTIPAKYCVYAQSWQGGSNYNYYYSTTYTPTADPQNISATLNIPTGEEIQYLEVMGITSGLCTDPDANTTYWANGFTLEGDQVNTIFTIIELVQDNNIWGGAGLFGTSTSMAATVASGVVDTGVNLWPLFSILGVLIAFAIAIKLQNFIMMAGAEKRREFKYYDDLSKAKNTEEEVALTKKYKSGK